MSSRIKGSYGIDALYVPIISAVVATSTSGSTATTSKQSAFGNPFFASKLVSARKPKR